MSEEIIQQLKNILKEKTPDLDTDSITAESHIRELGIDSLDFIEFIFEVENTFQIEIPTTELTKITTVQNLLDVITTTKSA